MRICCAGEVMVELAGEGAGRYRRGVAGDTFNTAVYLARAGLQVSYLTRLGDDALSDDILDAMAREGVDTGLVTRVPGRLPGLYLIDTDAQGERRFSYWRDRAPVRELFEAPVALPAVDLFYLSGITLAVTRGGLDELLALLRALREQGGRVAFDSNYRAALWDDADQARRAVAAVLPHCDIALPTLADERSLWGDPDIEACLARYRDAGVAEVAVKGDALEVRALCAGDTARRRAEPVRALDTTGAGDAFNAAYLAARLAGAGLDDALAAGQRLASDVVQHRGAIIPAGQAAPGLQPRTQTQTQTQTQTKPTTQR